MKLGSDDIYHNMGEETQWQSLLFDNGQTHVTGEETWSVQQHCFDLLDILFWIVNVWWSIFFKWAFKILCISYVTMTTNTISCFPFHTWATNATENDPLSNPGVATYQLASFLSTSNARWQSALSHTNVSLYLLTLQRTATRLRYRDN